MHASSGRRKNALTWSAWKDHKIFQWDQSWSFSYFRISSDRQLFAAHSSFRCFLGEVDQINMIKGMWLVNEKERFITTTMSSIEYIVTTLRTRIIILVSRNFWFFFMCLKTILFHVMIQCLRVSYWKYFGKRHWIVFRLNICMLPATQKN